MHVNLQVVVASVQTAMQPKTLERLVQEGFEVSAACAACMHGTCSVGAGRPLHHRLRIPRGSSLNWGPRSPRLQLVIVDEAHHAPAPSYMKIL